MDLSQVALCNELLARAADLERTAADDRETGESIETAIENGEGYTPDDAVDVAAGLQHGANSAEETAALLRRAAAALASHQVGQEPVPFAAESPAFEAHAKSAGLDMQQHPLHYLFLNPKTYAARQAWKAALQFAQPAHDSDSTPPAAGPFDSLTCGVQSAYPDLDLEPLIRLRNDLHTLSKHGVKDGWQDAAVELVDDVTKLIDGREVEGRTDGATAR